MEADFLAAIPMRLERRSVEPVVVDDDDDEDGNNESSMAGFWTGVKVPSWLCNC